MYQKLIFGFNPKTMSSLYKHLDYRTWLQQAADEAKKLHADYKYADLARALSVQPSYLSRVFRGEAHLNSDQIFLASRHFQLTTEETEYLNLLLEFNRTGISTRKNVLKKEILAKQNEQRDSRRHLSMEFSTPEQAHSHQEYFLEPLAPLVHAFLDVVKYRKDPKKIATALGLTSHKLEEILRRLENLQFIRRNPRSGEYEDLRPNIHLDKKSSLNQAYQLLFRQTGAERLKRLAEEDKIQMSVTFVADEETYRRIHDEYNGFIKRVRAAVQAAASERVYQLQFDLFPWDSAEE